MVMGDDHFFEPTDAQIADEEEAVPQMMGDAQKWDGFLALVDIMQEPWASEADDTRAYREARAVRVFNAGGCRFMLLFNLIEMLTVIYIYI